MYSIGLRHVHHLSPRVPNYRLQACLDAHPALGRASCVTMRETRRAFALTLWDEEAGRLVRFEAAEVPNTKSTFANPKPTPT